MAKKSLIESGIVTTEERAFMSSNELEAKGFVASSADIEALTKRGLAADSDSADVRSTYLKSLVATTQVELGISQKGRKGIPPAMDTEEQRKQLTALETVHTRFYEAVLKAVRAAPILDEQRHLDRARVWNNRSNFARSAKSTLRAWILAGHNLRGLVPGKTSKHLLQAEIQSTSGVIRKRALSQAVAERSAEALLQRIKAGPDPAQAVLVLEAVIKRLVIGLSELGVGSTAKLEDAMREHKFARTQTGLAWVAPVDAPSQGASEPPKKRIGRPPKSEAARAAA